MIDFCSICHNLFEKDEPLVANTMETFVCKPATAEDTVNPAKVTESQLIESRKKWEKTVVATQYLKYSEGILTDSHFNVRHAFCVAPISTGTSVIFSKDPLRKHGIRFSRNSNRGNRRNG